MRSWQNASSVDTSRLAQLELPAIVARTLARRGITGADEARAFLDPLHRTLTSPLELPGMEPALSRIGVAIANRESICVWGDFDVDGQTATSVLVQALGMMGARVTSYVPSRANEGHGVNAVGLTSLIDRGVQLVVTCDTGITAHDSVELARTRGVDFVITDHHEPGPTLPDAFAVVDPRLLAPDHPLGDLAGVGVAYELARALLESRQLDPQPLLDLVALGLVADVARLLGDTRTLVQTGIQALRQTPRLGLRTLAALAATDLPSLTEDTIGFEIAPRLNAVGRLGDANQAVEFLLTSDPVRANVLAAEIESLNIRRRLLTEQVREAAEEQLRADPGIVGRSVLMLQHPSWPGGVLGIVASQLVEKYQKPAVLLSAGTDGTWRGSARSIDGLDITAAIAACSRDLRGYGGHPMAAGMSLDDSNLRRFQRDLEATVEDRLADGGIPEEVLTVDEWLPLGHLSLDFADQLAPLAPFGAGNPRLVFATADLHLVSARDLGRAGRHRSLVVADEHGVQQEVLWWNSAQENLPKGKFDLAYSVRPATYRGERQLSIELRDVRPVAEAPIEIEEARPEVIDLRSAPSAASLPADCLIWAEAADRSRGSDRLHLHQAADFAIWTTPPSRADLASALGIVNPRRIYLIGVSPPAQQAKAYLEQLAGMSKYALRERGGKVSLSEVAAATGERELTVRLGLEWLSAAGHLRVIETDDGLLITQGASGADKASKDELGAAVQSLLAETEAYRSYFRIAAPEALVNF